MDDVKILDRDCCRSEHSVEESINIRKHQPATGVQQGRRHFSALSYM